MNTENSKRDLNRKKANPAEHPDEERSASSPTRAADRAPEAAQSGDPMPLEEQLAAVTAERDANYERWIRAQAELENYRKRVQKENEEIRLYATLPLVRDLLPALDNLHRAISAARETGNVEELAQGVEMVAKQIEDALASRSAVAIQAVGQPFDPNLHEAIQQLPSPDHPPMTVLDEVERGYRLGGRVVRPSRVVVSALPPEDGDLTADTESPRG